MKTNQCKYLRVIISEDERHVIDVLLNIDKYRDIISQFNSIVWSNEKEKHLFSSLLASGVTYVSEV